MLARHPATFGGRMSFFVPSLSETMFSRILFRWLFQTVAQASMLHNIPPAGFAIELQNLMNFIDLRRYFNDLRQKQAVLLQSSSCHIGDTHQL
jgi:hypothetical protein